MNLNISKETWTSAQDTIGGAASADVHTGYGHPGSCQTSKELHGGGNFPGKREKQGLAGVGADQSGVFRERRQDIDFPAGTKGKSGVNREDIPGAEGKLPERAESVASERN